jgi:hypothetical protein
MSAQCERTVVPASSAVGHNGQGSGETGSAAFEVDADGMWTRLHDSDSIVKPDALFDSQTRIQHTGTQALNELQFTDLSSDGSEAG